MEGGKNPKNLVLRFSFLVVGCICLNVDFAEGVEEIVSWGPISTQLCSIRQRIQKAKQ
jgi:hypothetical protein